jgi:hypothetical protein
MPRAIPSSAAILCLALSVAIASPARAFVVADAPVAERPRTREALVADCPSARYLPFFKEYLNEEQLGRLPCPIGAGLSAAFSTQDLDVGGLGPLDSASLDGRFIGGRVDVLVLPILDLYGIFTYANGSAQIEELPEERFTGTAMGGGALLSFAYPLQPESATSPAVFGSADFTYLWSDLSIFDDVIDSYTIAPRVGLVGGGDPPWLGGIVWAGASYQQIERDIAAGGAEFRIREREPWNALVGAQYTLRRRIDFIVEGGIGNRSTVSGQVTFRF